MQEQKQTSVDTIQDDINNQIQQNQRKIDAIKQSNPDTKLSDKQLIDLYDNFNNSGFVIF